MHLAEAVLPLEHVTGWGAVAAPAVVWSIRGETLFRQLSIDIEARTTLAVLGANGSGKSTFVTVLSRSGQNVGEFTIGTAAFPVPCRPGRGNPSFPHRGPSTISGIRVSKH